jgi:hypothetical protein
MNPRQYLQSFLKGLDYIPEGKVGKVMGHLLPSFYVEKQKVSQGRILSSDTGRERNVSGVCEDGQDKDQGLSQRATE